MLDIIKILNNCFSNDEINQLNCKSNEYKDAKKNLIKIKLKLRSILSHSLNKDEIQEFETKLDQAYYNEGDLYYKEMSKTAFLCGIQLGLTLNDVSNDKRYQIFEEYINTELKDFYKTE